MRPLRVAIGGVRGARCDIDRGARAAHARGSYAVLRRSLDVALGGRRSWGSARRSGRRSPRRAAERHVHERVERARSSRRCTRFRSFCARPSSSRRTSASSSTGASIGRRALPRSSRTCAICARSAARPRSPSRSCGCCTRGRAAFGAAGSKAGRRGGSSERSARTKSSSST